MTPAKSRRAVPLDPAPSDPFTAAEVDEFGQAITERLGHFQDVTRNANLAAVLRQRMRLTGSPAYSVYRQLLSQTEEWEALAPLLTVPETYFFRMPTHFEALAADVLPTLLERKRATRTLRILSAGCATGEEPYSIRILLNERFPELAGWEVSITGVDLSIESLERARAGIYTPWSLRATSAERREANFFAESKLFRLKPQARTGVSFRRENLLAPPPANEPRYDAIFCRNVLIYFTDQAMRTAIARLTERLAEGGYLFLGPAESLRGLSDQYELCQGHDVFFYRLRALQPGASADPVPRKPVRGGNAYPPITDQAAATWYASIEQSWQRLAALVPGRTATTGNNHAAAVPVILSPAAAAVLHSPGAAQFEAEAAFFALVAAERFAQALDLLESMQGPTGSAQAHGLLRASMLTNLGRYADAERECKLLLSADEHDAGAHFLLGLCHEQEGDFAGAAEQMSRAIYLDPSFPMAHLHRGLIARREGKPAAARTALSAALAALEHEDARRLTLFGGGLSRASLEQLCRRELENLQPALEARPRATPNKRSDA